MWHYAKFVQDKENNKPVIESLEELLNSGIQDIRIMYYMPAVYVKIEGKDVGIATLELVYKK